MSPRQPDISLTPFVSDRERRLWSWTLAVVMAIYLTLGLASTLVGKLLERGIFDQTFVFAFFMIGAAILTQGLKVRPRGIEIGVGLGVAAVYLMLFARLGIPERSHLFEYGVVAVLVYEALLERASQGRRVPLPALIAVAITSMLGLLDECIQWILPSRVFESTDALFNVLAASLAVAAYTALRWARGLVQRRTK